MAFKILQLDMISAPNYYGTVDTWQLLDPNAATLWMQVNIADSLGERRYVTATGATLSVMFQRADTFTMAAPTLTQTPASLTLPTTVHANDRSLFSLALTSQQVQTIVSGSVKFTLTEGATVNTWVQHHAVSKKMTAPGF